MVSTPRISTSPAGSCINRDLALHYTAASGAYIGVLSSCAEGPGRLSLQATVARSDCKDCVPFQELLQLVCHRITRLLGPAEWSVAL